MASKDDPRPDPLREYLEWARHRYDPGHYLGGTLPPHLRKNALGPRARKKAGLLLVVMTVLWLAAAASTTDVLPRMLLVALGLLSAGAAWKMYRS